MGIVNVTPDSFSDGGKYVATGAAVDHVLKLVEQGADIIDIGGESTRPYSQPVNDADEISRVIPVIDALAGQIVVPISIDTSKASVAKEAVSAGAEIINDVTGMTHPDMIALAAETGAAVCAMHMKGTPETMQDDPQYVDVVREIYTYLDERRNNLIANGIDRSKICLDPGIGFGKSQEHNLQLLRQVEQFHSLNQPILVGHSRKGFIRKTTGDESVEKLAGTIAVTLHLARAGIQVIRVHDVQAAKQAIAMQGALARE